MRSDTPVKGRGAPANPAGRYEPWTREPVDDGWSAADPDPVPLRTTVTVEAARTVISHNRSPDVPFEQSVNPYRGCEHGCIYCYARPSHAYVGLSPGLDFESRLFVKPHAAERLREELARPGYRCATLALGTNTDPYQPVEREWRVTRRILGLLAACRHPVSITTKSALVERDLDLLAPMGREGLAEVAISVTTLDHGLARRLEPRAAAPRRRIETVRRLADAGIPVGVMVAPVIPGLTDHELEDILEACADAGAVCAGWILLRLPLEVKDLFVEWLEIHEPLKAGRVMNRLREARGGRENDPRFGTRMTGEGQYAALLARRFQVACRRLGLGQRQRVLDVARFRPPGGGGVQMDLF